MKFVYNSRIAKLLNVAAITLWPRVFVAGSDASPTLFLHECVHCAQIAQHGVIGFYLKYLWQWMRVGFRYDRIPFEIEAYALEVFTMPKPLSESYYGDGIVDVPADLWGMRDLSA